MIMEEKKINDSEVIDLRLVAKKIWDNKRLFYKTLPVAFVLSCVYIFSLPRYYTSEVKLAPEMESLSANGTLGTLASSFGFDLSDMRTSDAITPLLYPDLMDDNGFVAGLMNIQVKSQDGELSANYHDYLQKYQKTTWWSYPLIWLKSLLPKKDEGGTGDGTFDPYNISRSEDDVLTAARNNINISIDKKTGVISIGVKAQDPQVCRILADSIKGRLQTFIIEYRTNKARTDYEYYKRLAADAKQDYEKTRRKYASMADAATHIALRSVELKLEDMENDMQLKYSAYTTINTQLQAAKAKVQERTPVFTVVKGASVPVKPAGPKRIIFVAGMLFLTIIGTAVYILKDGILRQILG